MKNSQRRLCFVIPFLIGFNGIAFANTDDTDDSFDPSYQMELIKLNKQIEELKKETDELKKSKAAKKWRFDTYIGTEQEIDSNENWKFIDRSMATSPYFGAYIYQIGSPWLYDIQILKTYIDHYSAYDRTRFQFGVTKTFYPFDEESKGNVKLRLGFRNDNWHYPSIDKESLALPTYQGDIRKGEERNEIWIRPQGLYKYSDDLSFHASLSLRLIDRKLDYARAKGEYGIYERDWSYINEDFAGLTYKINDNNSLWLNYLYIDEHLKRTLFNKEHHFWGVYRYKFDNGFMFMPYTRLALGKGTQSFRDSENNEFLYKKTDRSRFGFQTLYPITKQTSLFTDVYYRPEKKWTDGNKERNNFWFWALELRHNF